MNERQERIERLAERWFAAQATDAEERELREWMRRAADVPESLREVRTLFGIFESADLLRKPYCYIDGVAVYDAEVAMQTTVYLESFSALEESGRMVDELIENN